VQREEAPTLFGSRAAGAPAVLETGFDLV